MYNWYKLKSALPLHFAFPLFLFFVSLLLLPSCKTNKNVGYVQEGIIEYEIQYSNRDGKKFPFQVLPKVMLLKFNETHSCYTLEDRLGLFNISNIVNFKNKQHITLIKVFDKKYVYVGKNQEAPILFDSSVKYDLKYLDDTLRIICYLCKTANITDKIFNQNFNILYTNSIGNGSSNINSPYEAIHGMLLDFRLSIKSLDMQLKAKSIEKKIMNEEEFMIPKDYKRINRKQMEEILTTILP